MHRALNKHGVMYGAGKNAIYIFTPSPKTHIHLNDMTYHMPKKEPCEGHGHRCFSKMAPQLSEKPQGGSSPQAEEETRHPALAL